MGDSYTCLSEAEGTSEICSNCVVGAGGEISVDDDEECGIAIPPSPAILTWSAELNDPDVPSWDVVIIDGSAILFDETVSPGWTDGYWEAGTVTCTSISITYDDSPEEENCTNRIEIDITVNPARCEPQEDLREACEELVEENEDECGPEQSNSSGSPVHLLTGHKIESSTDLVVPLPGRDFILKREYTSNPEYYSTTNGQFWWNNVYTTVYPGMIGANWNANVFRKLLGGDLATTPIEMRLVGFPMNTSKAFVILDELATVPVWRQRGAGNAVIEESLIDTVNFSSNTEVYELAMPGKGRVYFAKYPDGFMPNPGTPNFGPEDIVGSILKEIDEHGNEWNYEWFSLTPPSSGNYRDSARLKSIYLNGDNTGAAARVDFLWHGQSGTSYASYDYDGDTIGDEELLGRLAEVQVVRFDSSTEIVTQRVRYTYFDEFVGEVDPFGEGYDLVDVYQATSGDLVEVVQSELVSNDFDETPSTLDYHDRATQYRYYNGDQSGFDPTLELAGPDLNLDGVGHQLMSVIYPAQMEYFADHLWQLHKATGVDPDGAGTTFPRSQPFDSVVDAAKYLRWISLGEPFSAMTLEEENRLLMVTDSESTPMPLEENIYWRSLWDITSKAVGYYTTEGGELEDRVKTQIVSSGSGSAGCGCASSPSGFQLGTRYDYLYKRYQWLEDVVPDQSGSSVGSSPDGYSCQVVESGATIDDISDELEFLPYRVYTHDYYWPTANTGTGMIMDMSAVSLAGFTGGVRKVAYTVSEGNESWDFIHKDSNDDSVSSGETPYSSAGDHWVTRFEYYSDDNPTDHEYSSYRKQSRKITPTAHINSEYVPSLGVEGGTESPTLPTIRTDKGLIYTTGYDDGSGGTSGWVTSRGVQEGDEGTVHLLTSSVRQSTMSGRPDLASSIKRHRSQASGDTEDTSISYSYFATTDVVFLETITTEIESVTQNGPGTGIPTRYRVYDQNGQVRWEVDESEGVTYRGYDETTGRVTRIIQDADPGTTYDTGHAFPMGLTLSSHTSRTEYEEFETTYDYDLLGRMIKMTDPGGVEMYMAYELRTTDNVDDPEATSPTLVDRGVPYMATVTFPSEYATGEYDGPITIQWQNAAGSTIRTSRFIADDDGTGSYDPNAGEYGLGAEVARADQERVISGVMTHAIEWHDLSASVSTGTYTTAYTYDPLGRLKSITDPEGGVVQYGTSTEEGYDVMDRPLVQAVGTATGGVHAVAKMYYDSPQTATQGVGNGNLTYVEEFTGETTGGTRVTRHWYDFRDRRVGTVMPEAPHESMAYDDQNRVIAQAAWTVDTNFDSSGVPDPTGAMSTRSRYAEMAYSERGLMYKSRIAIDPTSGSTEFLETNTWFDIEGLPIATWAPNSPAVKYTYDELDRVTTRYLTDRFDDEPPGTSGNYDDASSVEDDHVIAQSEYTYVDAGDPGAGGLLIETSRQRLHDEAESGMGDSTGALDNTTSVTTFVAYARDAAGRVMDTLRYGTNGSTFGSGTSAPTEPFDTTRSTSDALIDSVVYDDWGRVRKTNDPEGKGTITKYDDMSRVVATIENAISLDEDDITWSSGAWSVPTVANADQDRVTSFVFDGNGNVVRRTAHINDGSVQDTEYVYGTTNGSASNPDESLLNSASLLSEIHYPDESSGTAGATDAYKVFYAYNRRGEIRSMTDQNDTEHAYTRDDLGRVIQDLATIGSGSDIDDTIDRLVVAYDAHGRVSEVLSKDGATTVVNGAGVEYTPLHQVQRVYQNHDGDPDDSGVDSIGYAYANSDAATGHNHSRLAKVWYPEEMSDASITPGTALTTSTTGETLTFDYSGVINSAISRVTGLEIDGWGTSTDTLVSYEYLGANVPVVTAYPRATTSLDYTKSWDGSDPSGSYPGMDQYGRVVWHPWVRDGFQPGPNTGYPDRTPLMARRYAYDDMSNRIRDWDGRPGVDNSMGTTVPADKDWQYTYDGLDRLKEAFRGSRADDDFGTGDTYIKAAESRSWTLDILGNWDDLTTETDSDWNFGTSANTGARTHNAANEVTQFELFNSSTTMSPTYDDAGNIRESNTSNPLIYTHDPWNRLVKVEKDNGTSTVTVLENTYNPLNWRIRRSMDHGDVYDGLDESRDYFFDVNWRMVEERVDDDLDSAVEYTAQQFWGIRYIDDAVAKRIDRNNDGDWGDADSEFYYLTDVMFSVRSLIHAQFATVMERIDYTPYGVATQRNGADFNSDGDLDFFDITKYTNGTGKDPGDANYDPDVDTDGSGVIEYFDYSHYIKNYGEYDGVTMFDGWITYHDQSVTSSGAINTDNSFGYDGYWFDAAGAVSGETSGLYCVRFRNYDPALGRWLERDPLEYIDGSSMLQFVFSNPANYIDPLGLACQDCSCSLGDCDITVSSSELTKLQTRLFKEPSGKPSKDDHKIKHYIIDDDGLDEPFDPTKSLQEQLEKRAKKFAQKHTGKGGRWHRLYLIDKFIDNSTGRMTFKMQLEGVLKNTRITIQRCDILCENPTGSNDGDWGPVQTETVTQLDVVFSERNPNTGHWIDGVDQDEMGRQMRSMQRDFENDAMRNQSIIDALKQHLGCN